jgi:hypothetical protein
LPTSLQGSSQKKQISQIPVRFGSDAAYLNRHHLALTPADCCIPSIPMRRLAKLASRFASCFASRLVHNGHVCEDSQTHTRAPYGNGSENALPTQPRRSPPLRTLGRLCSTPCTPPGSSGSCTDVAQTSAFLWLISDSSSVLCVVDHTMTFTPHSQGGPRRRTQG